MGGDDTEFEQEYDPDTKPKGGKDHDEHEPDSKPKKHGGDAMARR